MTGRYPAAAGVPGNVGVEAAGLPANVPTIAKALKELGYDTYMSGKWHLGTFEPHLPHNHGFDHWFGFKNGCVDYYSHTFYWPLVRGKQVRHDLWEDGVEIFRNGQYMTELIAEKAVEYLKQQEEKDSPFFMYVPFNAPHYPMHTPQEYMDRFSHLPVDRQQMAAMISVMDDAIGKILDELERQGILDSTCIFFQPDHGPSSEPRNWTDGREEPFTGGNTGGLRGGKSTLWEGGIRVPTLMSWPERFEGGKTIEEVGIGMDIFPTFLNAAGGDASTYTLDGLDILPMVADGKKTPHDEIFWTKGRPGGQMAIRRGDMKLVVEGDETHLSDLKADRGETINLANEQPEAVAEMQERLQRWANSL